MSRAFLNRLIIFTFLLTFSSVGLTLLYAQEKINDSSSTFEHFLSLENYSDIQRPDGFFFNSSFSNSLKNNFFDIEFTHLDSWDKPKQYMMRLDSWGYSHLKIDPHFLEGKLIAEGEIAYSPTADFDPMLAFREYKTQMSRFYIGGTWSKFEYGVKYLYVNDGFDRESVTGLTSDKEGIEVWLKRSIGIFSIETSFSDYWNNVDFNPKHDRKEKVQGEVTLDFAIPSFPDISLSYKRGSYLKIDKFDRSDLDKKSIHAFRADLDFPLSPTLDVLFSSSYAIKRDVPNSDKKRTYFKYKLASTYQPTESIRIEPTLKLKIKKKSKPGREVETEITPAFSFSFTYITRSKNFEFDAYGGVSNKWDEHGFTRFTGKNDIEGVAKLFWKFGENAFGAHKLAIELGYFPSGDNVYEGASAVLAYRFALSE